MIVTSYSINPGSTFMKYKKCKSLNNQVLQHFTGRAFTKHRFSYQINVKNLVKLDPTILYLLILYNI